MKHVAALARGHILLVSKCFAESILLTPYSRQSSVIVPLFFAVMVVNELNDDVQNVKKLFQFRAPYHIDVLVQLSIM